MKTYTLAYPHNLTKTDLPDTVAAIGFFDGIHKGHQKVIGTAVEIAKANDQESAVITFDPHPSVVLKKDRKHVNYITPLKEKEALITEMGVDRLYIIHFNSELAQLDPKAFIDHFIIGLRIQHLVAGFDFSYGYKGKGSTATLPLHSDNQFEVTIIPKIVNNGTKISSTLIRSYLAEGDMEEANQLLDRPLRVRGIVVEGDKRGRTIGYPTANVEPRDPFLLPKVGVYAVHVMHHKNKYKGMANLGYKPTFQDKPDAPSIEVHLLDYQGDLYGEELTIEWQQFVREEKKFNGVEELVNQLKQDEQNVRSYFTTK
ncbi:bifunctional riboflavin kinase/FAD synthetase [Aquibacillus sp. 3ASR75-11]|uniref:Riboflavin biosynthesis protein n=1 Tax=Terrihalobacillus insolitus TaxID=2950438 RepID=A0A9X3WP23_9BACI|nr:bifunctional riboflavin kinase/FAD synthetase [Terrihalobacillus insolitus]MDC3414096.1 bifunctional riboflavin kinase/FAD synthetase [Terrihalobacillus insolitus]MDC3423537.1 bifunctional riboflavin kinase/FAD synthetase [Terrihalobacillus insolitus]